MSDPHARSEEGCGDWGELAVQLLAWAVRPACRVERRRDDEQERLPMLRERGIDSLWVFAHGVDDATQRVYDKVWREQLRLAAEFDAAMRSERIACLALKGLPLAARWFGGRALGCMGDIDVLVPREDVLRTIPVLYALGLRPRYFDVDTGRMKDRDVAEIAAAEARHYELVAYNRCVPLELDDEELAAARSLKRNSLRMIDGQPVAIVELDVHHGVASDLEPGEFFERAVEPSDGMRTLSDADHLWFGLSRLYAEVALHGKESLRDFAYLAPLVTRGEVDWPVVGEAAARLELRPALFYFLSFIQQLSGGAIPAGVLDGLNPRNGLRYRDWGWQIGRLLGRVDPPPSCMRGSCSGDPC
jgi:hypothetical protein